MTGIVEQLPNVIRIARKRVGISQTELGRRANIHRNTISRFECGDVTMKVADLIRMGDVLEIPADTLLFNARKRAERVQGEPEAGLKRA